MQRYTFFFLLFFLFPFFLFPFSLRGTEREREREREKMNGRGRRGGRQVQWDNREVKRK